MPEGPKDFTILPDKERSRMDIISGSSEPMKSTRSRSSFTDPSWIPVCRSMNPDEPIMDLAARITILLAASLMLVRPSSTEMKESCMPKSSANLYIMYGAESRTLRAEILFLGLRTVTVLSFMISFPLYLDRCFPLLVSLSL